MQQRLDDSALDLLFRTARTQNSWSDRPVTEHQLRELYELLKLGPTSANSCPARFVWVCSTAAKALLASCAMPANQSKILSAPVTVIVGYDLAFAERLPELFPARGAAMKGMFADPAVALSTAFRNSSLQGGYLILAARALGLQCGPMSGFNTQAVDQAFFAGSQIKSNFLCSLGYGTDEGVFPRNPRLGFEQAGWIA